MSVIAALRLGINQCGFELDGDRREKAIQLFLEDLDSIVSQEVVEAAAERGTLLPLFIEWCWRAIELTPSERREALLGCVELTTSMTAQQTPDEVEGNVVSFNERLSR